MMQNNKNKIVIMMIKLVMMIPKFALAYLPIWNHCPFNLEKRAGKVQTFRFCWTSCTLAFVIYDEWTTRSIKEQEEYSYIFIRAFAGLLICDLISECTENIMWNLVTPNRQNLLMAIVIPRRNCIKLLHPFGSTKFVNWNNFHQNISTLQSMVTTDGV